jgi:hypothetical protein
MCLFSCWWRWGEGREGGRERGIGADGTVGAFPTWTQIYYKSKDVVKALFWEKSVTNKKLNASKPSTALLKGMGLCQAATPGREQSERSWSRDR